MERLPPARAVEGEGITLHAWNGDAWEAPVVAPDSAELAVVSLVRSGEEIEAVVRHRETGHRAPPSRGRPRRSPGLLD